MDTSSGNIVIIYQSELEYLSRYTLDYPNIETGGQLFGFWNEDGTPVVTFVIGPGNMSNHELAFFQQDIEYLEKIGSVLTDFHGLKHIGEWHSHHKLGLERPSEHDAYNIQSKVDDYKFSQFLLCIGTISKSTSSITPYIFTNSETNFSKAKWSVINGISPSRTKLGNEDNLLLPKTENANYNVESDQCTIEITEPESVRKTENYWFSDKKNHPILKRIVDEINKSEPNKCHVFVDDDNHVFLEVADKHDKITILFPDKFPEQSPVIEFAEHKEINRCEWKYDGDIYNSFITYYKQLIN